jgi:hypothetical protein
MHHTFTLIVPAPALAKNPRHCRWMNIEKSCGVSASFRALCYHRDGFILLIRSEFWTTTSDAAGNIGAISAQAASVKSVS